MRIGPAASESAPSSAYRPVNRGPVGTFAVAGLATAIVVAIFVAFYFWVYLPRGMVQ